MITPLGQARLLDRGWADQSSPTAWEWEKPKFVFLLVWFLLEPCLGFVYRDVFCLTKNGKGKKKTFPYKCLITSVCSTELFCNKVCKGKINFFFFLWL